MSLHSIHPVLFLISSVAIAWPLSITINALLKRHVFAKKTPPDGSGWLSGTVASSQSSLFSFFSATLIALLCGQRGQIMMTSHKEASHLLSLSTLAHTENRHTQDIISDAIHQYSNHVINNEWSNMGNDHANWQKGRLMILNLRTTILNNEQGMKGSLHHAPSKFYDRVLDITKDLLDSRIERIQSAQSFIPQYIWLFLGVAALLVISTPGFYAIEKRSTHVFLMFALSTVVSTTLISLYYVKPRYSVHKAPGIMTPDAFFNLRTYLDKQSSKTDTP